MTFKNIEVYNVAELIPTKDGGVTWLRVPRNVDEVLNDMGRDQNRNSTGVELRFVMLGPEVTIRIRSTVESQMLNTYQIFFGGLQGGWNCHELNCYIGAEPVDIVVKFPHNPDKMQKIHELAGWDWDARVVRIVFNRGPFEILDVIGRTAPPQVNQTPEKTLLCYGSSITHGSNSYVTPNNWTWQVAHQLNYDLRNLGFAGSCLMEPLMVEYLASLGEQGKWDTAILELGINAVNFGDDFIYERVPNVLKQIAGRNPDKTVFVVSPFYCYKDFNGKSDAQNWRTEIEKICRLAKYPNVVYISGTDILPDMTYISADEVHPNIYGVDRIAQKLGAIVKKTLGV